MTVPAEALIMKITGKNLIALERKIDARELTGRLLHENNTSVLRKEFENPTEAPA
jgi:hypothetical protein